MVRSDPSNEFHLGRREVVGSIVVQTEYGEIKIGVQYMLQDSLPLEWTDQGLKELDYTLLWRSLVQQQGPETIARTICETGTNLQRAVYYFKERIEKARRIVESSKVSLTEIRPRPKMLLERIKGEVQPPKTTHSSWQNVAKPTTATPNISSVRRERLIVKPPPPKKSVQGPKLCPKCSGSMIYQESLDGPYSACFSCGYVYEPGVQALPSEDPGREGTRRKKSGRLHHGKTRL
ncbi:MAG: hypothetical protein A2864_01175 [Candidatus Woykebacteria bacterium RIFCSPHIGHO2_01_FULL_39_12]|uniref:Uncharacterized protein n=1 Tax=Candidatus Woykebacteria bacterium RIFCSPHIGHO2_01_FULL_39_12 TaxID=1802599 RepID=A0A1G1WGX1_9BACT|nr:MAG: hypothetical protein A2864_01175 [Candidatus Woykebacteria bacterium RIFCSPHIGHO2_01_FULL_39_12]